MLSLSLTVSKTGATIAVKFQAQSATPGICYAFRQKLRAMKKRKMSTDARYECGD